MFPGLQAPARKQAGATATGTARGTYFGLAQAGHSRPANPRSQPLGGHSSGRLKQTQSQPQWYGTVWTQRNASPTRLRGAQPLCTLRIGITLFETIVLLPSGSFKSWEIIFSLSSSFAVLGLPLCFGSAGGFLVSALGPWSMVLPVSVWALLSLFLVSFLPWEGVFCLIRFPYSVCVLFVSV